MDKKYNEIMDRVEVTPEMRARILTNISNADLSKNKAKVTVFTLYKKQIIGAVAALLIVGAIVVSVFVNSMRAGKYTESFAPAVNMIKDEEKYEVEDVAVAEDDSDIRGVASDNKNINTDGVSEEAASASKSDVGASFLLENAIGFIYCDSEGHWYKLCDEKAQEAFSILCNIECYECSPVDTVNWKCFIVKTKNDVYDFTLSGNYMTVGECTYRFDYETDISEKLIAYFLENADISEADYEFCHP